MPASAEDLTDQLPWPVAIRVDRRARRLSVRIDVKGNVVLTVPRERDRKAGIRFLLSRADWVEARRSDVPETVPFEVGRAVPVRGRERTIVLDSDGADPVILDEDAIRLRGPSTAAPKLVSGLIRSLAQRDLEDRSRHFAERLGVAVEAITLRDPKGRWGSCSARGRLSFSWRLVMAPGFVLDYVAAHEVAHLREMNHSPRFWGHVETIHGDPGPAQAWLRTEGSGLHRYG